MLYLTNVYTHRTAAFVLAWRSKLDIVRILWRASPTHTGTPEIMFSTRHLWKQLKKQKPCTEVQHLVLKPPYKIPQTYVDSLGSYGRHRVKYRGMAIKLVQWSAQNKIS